MRKLFPCAMPGIRNILPFLLCFSSVISVAKEGLWLPATLKDREADMKKMGLEIPIDQIYNDEGTGLNNAVVLFGKGCTGEIISPKGLILTNHHCGYGSVQGLSSDEHDYFSDGFWAKNMQEEIPCPGLTVTFVRKMENVTNLILNNIPDTLDDADRNTIIATRIKGLEKGYRVTTGMDATIKPYYEGNQYWVCVTETYRDIRLVGFPPNGIGNFGGDVENWMWPRHTGDFSMFRVYAGAGNKPADYSPENKPYQAKEFFTINAKGYKEGDFTMVYGFPGYTEEYISSYELNQTLSINDPVAIAARTKKLDVWNKHIGRSREVFLKYTSKRAYIANGWKKWQGEVQGLENNDVLGKKQAYERDFQSWAVMDTAHPYATNLLAQIEANTSAIDSTLKEDDYIRESVLGIELVQQGAVLDKILACYRAGFATNDLQDTLDKLVTATRSFYKNYDVATDKDLFTVMMPFFIEHCPRRVPAAYRTAETIYKDDINAWADAVYSTSAATSQDRLSSMVADAAPGDSMRILSDPAWQLYHAINDERQKTYPNLVNYYRRERYLNRLYMKSQMAQDHNKAFYPDANLTLRLTYGKVQGLSEPSGYSYQTTLNDVMALSNDNDENFHVPQKLKDLYEAKNFGRWAQDGTVPVAFIASNHTTGGNSGSPVLNGKGQLIGINFDRAWEGTMSDLYYDPKVCRNISVDMRYVLFVVEKFGDAGWLLKEMKIVNNTAPGKK